MVDMLGICLAGSGKLMLKSFLFDMCLLHWVGHACFAVSVVMLCQFRAYEKLNYDAELFWGTMSLRLLKCIGYKILVLFYLFLFFLCYCYLGTILSVRFLPARVSVCSWIQQGISFQQRLSKHKYHLKLWGSLMDVQACILDKGHLWLTDCEKINCDTISKMMCVWLCLVETGIPEMSLWVWNVVLFRMIEAVQFKSTPWIVSSLDFLKIWDSLKNPKPFNKFSRVVLFSPFIYFPNRAVFICCESGPSE